MLRTPLLATVLVLASTVFTPACALAGDKAGASAAAMEPAVDRAGLAAAIGGQWRDPKNAARDVYRHPSETLTFFGIGPKSRVVEITPGASGWYTEILAPYLRDGGAYTAAVPDPATAADDKGRDNRQKGLDDLKARLARHPAQFDRVGYRLFTPKTPEFAEPGTLDAVLTFRNVHNWVAADTADAFFAAFFAALKPGGVLGVVDHRAKPGTDLETMKKSGYLTEELVIQLATKAGFVLEARSEINANPKDTADHPNGVWTLPPTNRHDAEEDAQYRAIGESDRMTLRFVKPAR